MSLRDQRRSRRREMCKIFVERFLLSDAQEVLASWSLCMSGAYNGFACFFGGHGEGSYFFAHQLELMYSWLRGSRSIFIPKFLIWSSENLIGSSYVTSTSTMVEHGGVVGKWIVQLLKHICVFWVCEHNCFVATAKFCGDTTISRMFQAQLYPSPSGAWEAESLDQGWVSLLPFHLFWIPMFLFWIVGCAFNWLEVLEPPFW